MKVAIDTYGCTRNKADQELIEGQIETAGRLELSSLDEAELVILNSCGVKNKTQSKMINRIKSYRERGKRLLVSGCLPKINRELLEDLDVSMVGPNSIESIPKAIEEIKAGERPLYISEEHKNKLDMKKSVREGVTGIVPIAEGCLGNCSYCGVKRARGELSSYPEEEIVERVKELAQTGKKQIYLTSQDTGCYGYDIEKSLPELLENLTSLENDFKIRVGMMNPEHALKMKKDLIDTFKSEKIYSFLHLPVQSGSDSVLDHMNRRYSSEEFKSIVRSFREEIPDLNLATDIIVGYPTEEEEDLQKTLDLVKSMKPDVTNISRFHPRPDTEAKELNPLSSQVLKKRSRRLSKVSGRISLRKNKRYIGRKLRGLVTEQLAEESVARTNNYKKVRIPATERGWTEIKITDAGKRGLRGELINT